MRLETGWAGQNGGSWFGVSERDPDLIARLVRGRDFRALSCERRPQRRHTYSGDKSRTRQAAEICAKFPTTSTRKSEIYQVVESWLCWQSRANPSPRISLIIGDLQGIPMILLVLSPFVSTLTPAAQRVLETIPYSPEQGIGARLPATAVSMIKEI